MKSQLLHTIRGLLLFASFILAAPLAQSQGHVVINEYMPWPGSSCGTTAEFVELLNFGPGPVDIGCYILTDGDYSITIPEGTVLQPGQFYVIGGRDSIEAPCANLDSTIRVHLNWNKCGCTSAPIPTTGDGFMTDGGTANEQVVLLDPQLNIIDAVARSLPVESSTTITTMAPAWSSCPNSTFNLNLLNVVYETIGQSAGRGNSFAKSTDGDCGWVKDPQQSSGATNNRGGEVQAIQYNFCFVKASTCGRDGKVAVTVTAPDYAAVFPMPYILALDSNNNGQFDVNDQYTTGVVTNPNTITIDSLRAGNYRLTVSSAKGCYLRTFPFNISGCAVVTLPLKLRSFIANRMGEDVRYGWTIEEANLLDQVVVEGSDNGNEYQILRTIPVPVGIPSEWTNQLQLPTSADIRFVRIRMITRLQEHSWSQTIQLGTALTRNTERVYPNPTRG
ncbi:MAG: lamin tail domain-containing protein [Bacteroidota bacterium]